jgi:hypothetical protein
MLLSGPDYYFQWKGLKMDSLCATLKRWSGLKWVARRGVFGMSAAKVERIFEGGKLASTLLMGVLAFAHIGCGGEGVASQQNLAASSSVYLPTNPLSPSKSESVVSSLITSKIPTGPLFAQLAEPTWTWSVVPYWADILQFSALDGRQYSASAYKAGVEQVRPAFPLPPDEGRVTIYAASYFQGTVGDDGVTLQLNGETFSGIPSGAPVLDNGGGVTRTDTITREDGSSVSKQWHLYPIADGSGSGFAPGPYTAVQRYLTVIPSQAGVGFRNVGASGVNTTLQFDLVTQGTPQPTLNTWTVKVVQSNNTTNQPFHVFSPTSDSRGPGIVSTLSNGVHVDLPWDRKNSSGNVIEGDFTWVLAANATLPGGTAGAAANTTYKLEQQTEKGIRISDPPTANDFDPTAGENTTLKFDVTTTGIPNPEINWDVEVRDATNTTFHKFPTGHSTDGRTTVPVTIGPWLGNNTSGNIISGPFTWVIAANTTATVASTEGAGDAVAATNVLLVSQSSDFSSLKVIAGKDSTGRDDLVATAYNSDTATRRAERLGLLEKVRAIDKKVLNIEVKGLTFDTSPTPSSVTVKVHSEVSNKDKNVVLNVTNASYGNYAGQFILTSEFSGDPDALIRKDPVPGTTICTNDWRDSKERDLKIGTAFRAAVTTSANSSAYPTPRQPLGSFISGFKPDSPDVYEQNDVAKLTKENFGAFGFEAVTFTVVKSELKDPNIKNPPKKAVAKVTHPASVVFFDIHGTHDARFQDSEGRLFAPQFALPEAVKTLILGSCDSLDLSDFNNFFSTPFISALAPPSEIHAADASTAYRLGTMGGRYLYDTFGQKRTTMLGYNGIVGNDGVLKMLPDYIRQTALNKSEPEAWIKANLTEATGQTEFRYWLNANACAFGRGPDASGVLTDFYYFIYYKVPQIDNITIPLEKPLEGMAAYKIPRSNWTKERGDWKALPDDVGKPF